MSCSYLKYRLELKFALIKIMQRVVLCVSVVPFKINKTWKA